MSSEKVEVGQCPNCGLVSEDEVDFRFPNKAKCNNCGAKLERTRVVTEAELRDAMS